MVEKRGRIYVYPLPDSTTSGMHRAGFVRVHSLLSCFACGGVHRRSDFDLQPDKLLARSRCVCVCEGLHFIDSAFHLPSLPPCSKPIRPSMRSKIGRSASKAISQLPSPLPPPSPERARVNFVERQGKGRDRCEPQRVSTGRLTVLLAFG